MRPLQGPWQLEEQDQDQKQRLPLMTPRMLYEGRGRVHSNGIGKFSGGVG